MKRINDATLRRQLERLAKAQPVADCALVHRNAFELLVATILSAQCTDERVNMVTPALFAPYPTPAALASASIEEVQSLLRSINFFRNKSKNIVAAASVMVERFGGEVPRTMAELLTLPGVARKTANVVLGTAFGIADGVVVDTHVERLATRLGFVTSKGPQKIEQELMQRLPKNLWIVTSHRLILFGRSTCRARNPACEVCPLALDCPSADVG